MEALGQVASGNPQVTGTPGHDKASENLAKLLQERAIAAGETVESTTYNRSAERATGGLLASNKRPDAIVQSIAPDGGKVIRLGEAVSPSQTVENQLQKLDAIASGAPGGVRVENAALRFAKGTGRLLPGIGVFLIGYSFATDPEYGPDDLLADSLGIGEVY